MSQLSVNEYFCKRMREQAENETPLEYKPYFVEVDGVQVFSANHVFEQMQAQGCRIDRVKSIALFASAVAIISLISVFVLWKLCC